MSEAREIRAKALAAVVGGKYAAASVKPKGGLFDRVRFGMVVNAGVPMVSIPFETFDAMGDDEVIAQLRAAWGK